KLFTEKIINEHNIDIVHLNSVSLFPLVPYLQKQRIPYVWHIREHAPKPGNLLFAFVTSSMKKTKNLIFLSEAEQVSWLSDKFHGTVVYNFINENKFNGKIDVHKVLEALNISSEHRAILYLGGLKEHKGVEILIEALRQLVIEYPTLKCIMPDSFLNQDEQKSILQRIKALFRKNNFQQRMVNKIE